MHCCSKRTAVASALLLAKLTDDVSVQNMTDDVCRAAALGLLPYSLPLVYMWVCVCCCPNVKTLELFHFCFACTAFPGVTSMLVLAKFTLTQTALYLNLLCIRYLPGCLVGFLAPAL